MFGLFICFLSVIWCTSEGGFPPHVSSRLFNLQFDIRYPSSNDSFSPFHVSFRYLWPVGVTFCELTKTLTIYKVLSSQKTLLLVVSPSILQGPSVVTVRVTLYPSMP